MSLKLGNIAPNFTADTTHGMINFYEWMGDSWTILLSHPDNFNEIGASELVWIAQNERLFTERNAKVISLSAAKLIQYSKLLDDIRHDYKVKITMPLISDKSMRIAKLYNMIYDSVMSNSNKSTLQDSTARAAYLISPDKKIASMHMYPVNVERNFNEMLRLLDALSVRNIKNVPMDKKNFNLDASAQVA